MSLIATQGFRRMDESTKAQWDRISVESDRFALETADRMLALLRSLAGVGCGFAVDQLVHVTQTATRAERDGADDEVVVAALCHDVGKAISVYNHAAVAADLLQPFVRPEVEWVVRVHQDFQGRHYYEHFGMDPAARERYRDHPSFSLAATFADEWDQTSFDPDYDTLPLEHFEPRLRSVFAHPRAL